MCGGDVYMLGRWVGGGGGEGVEEGWEGGNLLSVNVVSNGKIAKKSFRWILSPSVHASYVIRLVS